MSRVFGRIREARSGGTSSEPPMVGNPGVSVAAGGSRVQAEHH